jgi:hypothetical protein
MKKIFKALNADLLLGLILVGIWGSTAVLAMATTLSGKETHNPCTDATPALMKHAWDLKAEARDLRGNGSLDLAAAKYEEAAAASPQAACAAAYLLNAEGCLVSRNKAGSYRIDHARAVKNAVKARDLLAQVQIKIDEAKGLDCDCKGAPLSDSQAWHDAALAALDAESPAPSNP